MKTSIYIYICIRPRYPIAPALNLTLYRLEHTYAEIHIYIWGGCHLILVHRAVRIQGQRKHHIYASYIPSNHWQHIYTPNTWVVCNYIHVWSTAAGNPAFSRSHAQHTSCLKIVTRLHVCGGLPVEYQAVCVPLASWRHAAHVQAYTGKK